jgi:hypothetical protein
MSKKNLGGSNTSSLDLFLQTIQSIRTKINSKIPTEKEELIILNPAKDPVNIGKKIDVDPLENGSFLYVFLLILISIVCNPILLGLPFLVLSLWYLTKIVNFKQLFKNKAFYGDDISYIEVTELYNIFNIAYINDFVMFLIIFCIFYSIALIYLTSSSYVNKNTKFFTKQKMDVYVLLGGSIFIALMTIFFNSSGTHSMNVFGGKRDEFDNQVYENIDINYIEYLDSINPILTTSNDLENLQMYILDLVGNIEGRQNISFSQFKKLKSENGDLIYKQISSSIITFGILLNLKINRFEEFTNNKIDKSFFQYSSSLLPTISTATNDLFVTELKAFEMTNDSIETPYVQGIINYCKKEQHEINCLLSKIKQVKNIMIPYYHLSILSELILCVSYYTLVFMGV